MELPYHFPNEAEVIRREAAAFRRLSATERLEAIRRVIASGVTLLERSPYHEVARRLRDAREAEWQRIQKELFARYAASQSATASERVMPSLGLFAQTACIWEATARKPGNVHRFADFDDATYLDFLMSAAAIAPVLATVPQRTVGELVFEAIRVTRQIVSSNTNLGIVLLLAPLAKMPSERESIAGVETVLAALTVEDTRQVYAAIRMAHPGGLGRVDQQDIAEEPTLPLRRVMALATGHDMIARQYANGFWDVFEDGVPALIRGLETTGCLEGAIIFCHLSLMAAHPDSLIARKRGTAEAEESSRRARAVLDADWPHSARSHEALTQLDDWLRAVGRGRNPGTTADLVTASLFVALREGIIKLPPAHPWTLDSLFDIKNPTLP